MNTATAGAVDVSYIRRMNSRVAGGKRAAVIVLAGVVALSGCAGVAPKREPSSADAAPVQAAVSAQATRQPPQQAPQQSSAPVLPPFSASFADAEVPNGWQPWIIHPRKRKTSYRIVRDAGIPVLVASASGSASGLMTQVAIDPKKRPMLRWRWRVDSLVADADNADGSREDAPVRVVLAFDGDKSALPIGDRMFFERVKLLSGNDLPYATLMYIWGNRRPVGTVLRNPHSGRIRNVVVDSGPNELKRWRLHRRNIVEDYRRAFGTEPGRLIGVAVLTDTDNTGGSVSAAYGDIELLER